METRQNNPSAISNGISTFENPFSLLYLSEPFIRETESIIKKGLMSPKIFNISEIMSVVTEPMNHFVIGVPGSGKTMVLAFLRLECLSFIDSNPNLKNEFKGVLEHVSRGLWGIYHGLLLNEEFLSPSNFAGFDLSDDRWTEIFGDFINTVFLRRMLVQLITAMENKDHHFCRWLGLTGKDAKFREAVHDFGKDISLTADMCNPSGLLKWAKLKLFGYQKMIKERNEPRISEEEINHGPFFKDIGYLPTRFVSFLRAHDVISANQKVLFIIDEYDQCEYSGKRFLAKAINSFVKITARGPLSNIFVKVGTRPHGFYEKGVLEGVAKIEDGRDYREINLKVLREQKRSAAFSELIHDIANRRLKNTTWFNSRNLTDIKKLFETLTPIQEAEMYRSGKADPLAHFRPIEEFYKAAYLTLEEKEQLVSLIQARTNIVLYQKYLVIEACRELRRAGRTVNSINGLLIDSLNSLGKFLENGAKIKDNSKFYYKIKDLREPALFLLASEYKQQKTYSGIDTIRLMSEGILISFIKLCSSIFDEVRYKIPQVEKERRISYRWQNRAIRKVASDFRKETGRYLCSGEHFQLFIDELGFIFRAIQLHPTAPYPTPNGFSVEREVDWISSRQRALCDVNFVSPDPETSLKEMIREATDWGYLIELTHRSKSGSLKTRTKYYLNAMLSPYYDLSVRHLKEPYYVDIADLIELSATDTEKRAAIRKTLMRKIKRIVLEDLKVSDPQLKLGV